MDRQRAASVYRAPLYIIMHNDHRAARGSRLRQNQSGASGGLDSIPELVPGGQPCLMTQNRKDSKVGLQAGGRTNVQGPASGPRGAFAKDPRVRCAGMIAVVLSLGAATACSGNMPDPASTVASAPGAAFAAPGVTSGHDADSAASSDMTMAAGETLAAGVPVGISDGLKDADGWKQVRNSVQGENRFTNDNGCVVSTRVRGNQAVLAVPGDDKASTVALFQYLDPGILPEYLRMDTLRWGDGEGNSGPRVDVLSFEGTRQTGSRATVILARVFSKAGSSVYVSVSCPKAEDLDRAREEVVARLPVVPPGA